LADDRSPRLSYKIVTLSVHHGAIPLLTRGAPDM
jgi:hypothetical protein